MMTGFYLVAPETYTAVLGKFTYTARLDDDGSWVLRSNSRKRGTLVLSVCASKEEAFAFAESYAGQRSL